MRPVPALGRENPGPGQRLGEGAQDLEEEQSRPGALGHIYTTQAMGDTGRAWEEAAGRVPGKCDRRQSGSWALEMERKERVERMQI